jgi:hypothetical protein
MPAQSPSVIPIRSFFPLMLLPVIVIEFAHSRTSVVATGRDIAPRCPDAAARRSTLLQERRSGVVGWSAYTNCFAGSVDRTSPDSFSVLMFALRRLRRPAARSLSNGRNAQR